MSQKKQEEWAYQWSHYYDDNLFLFKEWIYPNTLEDFKDKTALDAGCGAGQHINFIAPYAKKIIGIDLSTADIARENNIGHKNVEIREGDIAAVSLPEEFDIVYSIGVIHHTDNPDATVDNLKKLVKSGGKLIAWVYSYEGNFLNRAVLEFLKRKIILKLPRPVLPALAGIFTAFLYLPVYTIYFLPLKFLPYYQYFENFRKLPFKRNELNVFDKLNAPQTFFIKKEQVKKWFSSEEFSDIWIDNYKGVSWRASGVKL